MQVGTKISCPIFSGPPLSLLSHSRTAPPDNVSLHIKKGDFVTIPGPSGYGKATLLRILIRRKKIRIKEGENKNNDIRSIE